MAVRAGGPRPPDHARLGLARLAAAGEDCRGNAKAGAGWAVLLAGLFALVVMRSQYLITVEAFTQIPVLLGCVLLLGGWTLARIFAFPIAFLFFSFLRRPGDGFLQTVPLKAWISDVVTNFLYDLGYPIAQNGVMIMIGPYQLLVKDACSGMNSIFALSAIGIFYVYEFVRNNWFRGAVLILSTTPYHHPCEFLPRAHAGSRFVLFRRRRDRGTVPRPDGHRPLRLRVDSVLRAGRGPHRPRHDFSEAAASAGGGGLRALGLIGPARPVSPFG